MVTIIKGNIFTSTAQTLVNTINCVGVMGAGIAYEFRLRYPLMFKRYVELCNERKINIGTLWLYKADDKWILNFPTKYDWKNESKVEYLEKGLSKFVATYKEKGITSIAFPTLGSHNGGIPEEVSLSIMNKYLEQCDLDVTIYLYDPDSYDDLFLKFKEIFQSLPDKLLVENTGIRTDKIKILKRELENEKIKSLSRLLLIKGIGDITLEKLFIFIMNYKPETNLFT